MFVQWTSKMCLSHISKIFIYILGYRYTLKENSDLESAHNEATISSIDGASYPNMLYREIEATISSIDVPHIQICYTERLENLFFIMTDHLAITE